VLAATTDLYQDEMLDDLLQIQTTYEKKYLAVGKNINYLKFSFE
jgi:tRNA (guanine-N7-)-methyltransferase